MPRPDIGTIECGICGHPEAHVRESERGFAYTLCEECGHQGFTRSAFADNKLRAKMQPIESKPEPEKKPAPAPKPEPEKKPAPAPKPEPKKETEADDWEI